MNKPILYVVPSTDRVEDKTTPPHTTKHAGGDGGGSNMLEVRVAKLEANIEDIKANLAEARADIRDLRKTSADTTRDVGVILQKLVDIDDKISKKPSSEYVESKISGIKGWFLTVLLFSIAMPIITLLVNLYVKKG